MAMIEIQKTLFVAGKEVHMCECVSVTDAAQLNGDKMEALLQ